MEIVKMTAAEDVTVSDEKKTLITLKVLSVVREAQLAHGLRHNDYQLYRQYCSRRIRRLRKALGLVQGERKNFKKKEVMPDNIKDERYLYIPLVTAECRWAYAMQLKDESMQEPRKKFAMRNKLRKAAKHAVAFDQLVEACGMCDARTQLEVQGYSAWLQGTVLFELADWNHEWGKPVEFFNRAHAIYSKLLKAVSENDAEAYSVRLQELEVKLRFCRHHLGDKNATDTLLAMRGSEALGDKLDNLLAEAKEHQAATLSEVTWKGRTLAVTHEKVRLFLLNEGLIHDELKKVNIAEERVEMLDHLLMECKDALQLVRDDLKNDASFKPRQHANEGAVTPLHFLHTYLSFLRLNLTVMRNLALIRSYENVISGAVKLEDGKKAPKMQDIVRLHDIIIQCLNEMTQLAGLEDDAQLRKSVAAQVVAYRALRCYHISESYAKLEKWLESLVLYEKTLAHIEAAKKNPLDDSLMSDLNKLTATIDGKKFVAHAQAVLAAEGSNEDEGKEAAANKEKMMLIDRLDEYYEDPNIVTCPSLVPIPPPMMPVACKPLFFDLALNHVAFPSLEDKIESKKTSPQQQGGISGLVKGLWGGWGSKK